MSQSKYQNMTTGQIIADLDAISKIIEYHYDIENNALKTDDLYNGTMVEFIADTMAENDNDAMDYNWYMIKADEIVSTVADDVAAEIYERDNDAMEYENERHEAMKGNY